jgi:hypothetical protein
MRKKYGGDLASPPSLDEVLDEIKSGNRNNRNLQIALIALTGLVLILTAILVFKD